MGSINLYKIDNTSKDIFNQEIKKKFMLFGKKNITRSNEKNNTSYSLALYVISPQQIIPVKWNWLPNSFNKGDINTTPAPKAVLTIEHDNLLYAVTYGHSFFTIDKYCDRSFSFDFARKIEYNKIKTTTLTTPNTRRNKTVNTYINYNELEFESGESYAKLKAEAKLPKGFSLFKPVLEIGSSIKFSIESESLSSILDIIEYVEKTIKTKKDLYKIPVFSKIKDKLLIENLDMQLASDIKKDPSQINVSELDIIGATEIFNINDSEFIVKYGLHEKEISILNYQEISLFCTENNLKIKDIFLDISVISKKDGDAIRTDKVRNLIDHTNDIEKCILSKGTWFKYNDDYLQYLKDSILEIEVIYDPIYDFTNQQYDDFLDLKYDEEKSNIEYKGKKESEIKRLIKQKYYTERSFNLLRELNDDFINYDREEERAGSAKIEINDLYKDKTMYAVKIGATSSKLCYVIDQSLTSLKMYKHKTIRNLPEIDIVAIWLILERKTPLEMLPNGKINIDELNMLMLKNKIDQWKKEVRLVGKIPRIYINYKKF